MWVICLGSSGTCKRAVVDELVKSDGFTFDADTPPTEYKTTFARQLSRVCNRWFQATNIGKRVEEADFITIRSFWDTAIYTKAHHVMKEITDDEFGVINEVFGKLSSNIPVPHGVLFFKATEIQTNARQALQGKQLPATEFESLVKIGYEIHVGQIRLPVVEVEVTDDFQIMMDEVRTAMTAFRSSNVGAPTIWKRSYYK